MISALAFCRFILLNKIAYKQTFQRFKMKYEVIQLIRIQIISLIIKRYHL